MNLCTTMRPLDVGGESCGGGHALARLIPHVSRARFGVFAMILVSVGVFLKPTTAQAADRWETLQAIHMVENPTNSQRVGRRGELGPYQFRPTTWKMYTKKSFHLAIDRAESDRVAVKHYEWIKEGLERNGVEATPYHVALAWNAGLAATIRGNVGAGSRSYAQRVETIAQDLQKQQVASQP